MAQQVGRGAAPAAQQTEAAPGGVSGRTEADPSQNGTGSGRIAAAGQDRASRAGQDRAGRVRGWLRRNQPAATVTTAPQAPGVVAAGPELDLASNDPLVGYLLSAASAVDITGLQLQSPALQRLKEAGVVLVVPLISSGSLVGLLSLGPRRSERGYSTDDMRLLNSLAGYAAPAMRVGQLGRSGTLFGRNCCWMICAIFSSWSIRSRCLASACCCRTSWPTRMAGAA